MDRRTYIYWALPLFVLLSCGKLLGTTIGSLGALVVAGILMIVAWGVVWLRLYRSHVLRPEFAILSILPYAIYYIYRYSGSTIMQESPVYQNLYALTWLGFVGTVTAGMRQESIRTIREDNVFLFMAPIILLYTACTFIQYYSQIAHI